MNKLRLSQCLHPFGANKTGIDFMIFISLIHDFSVWIGIGSYPAKLNRFQSHTVKLVPLVDIFIWKKRYIRYKIIALSATLCKCVCVCVS